MSIHIVKFYPAGNGDTSLITLADKTSIQIDCHIREVGEDSDGNNIFIIKDDLLNSLQRKDSKPYVDLFILTHPDIDHCRGFENHYLNNKKADDYNHEDEEAQKIIIGELWVTSKIFSTNNCNCDDAKAVRREALRRKRLYDDDKPERDEHGNKLRLIGYDGEEKLENIPHYHPGLPTINEFNQTTCKNFELFLHAPFKEELQQADAEKNNTSIAFQARFKYSEDEDFLGKVLFGGDSDHYVWKKIKEETEEKENEGFLEWDILLAPHHCSWSFFNNRPYNENETPEESSLEIIGDTYKQEGAYIIASSKLIVDNDDNPPHYPAMTQYKDNVGVEYFFNTSAYPQEEEAMPLVFEFESNDNGFKLLKQNIAAGTIISSTRSHRSGNYGN